MPDTSVPQQGVLTSSERMPQHASTPAKQKNKRIRLTCGCVWGVWCGVVWGAFYIFGPSPPSQLRKERPDTTLLASTLTYARLHPAYERQAASAGLAKRKQFLFTLHIEPISVSV